MFMPTLREVPAEAVVASHRLLLRAGMIRKLSNGLFTYLPLGLRSFRKVENIIREEMDATGSLEFKPSVVVPGDIWRESGRWETMGPGMLRIKNRVDQELVVSPPRKPSSPCSAARCPPINSFPFPSTRSTRNTATRSAPATASCARASSR
jgi:hypothetical protein